ncbi:MAG: GNAT family N-acetyltransferase [Pedobacter sp.]|nr:MAG: GNAT family N-acetyltransferase [Pedobacter sp.]
MVRFISSDRTLELRSKILRKGRPLNDCIFPTDQLEGAFHLGCFNESNLVSIGSFFPKKYNEYPEDAYQLRGMATDTEFTGMGYAAKIIEFAVSQLNATDASYLWCNARTSAVGFYTKMGFEVISEEFEIEGVGPHYEMILKIK